MSLQLQWITFIGMFFLLPGLIGAWIARTKGRNPLLWFVINGLLAPTLMITIFQGPVRAVPGYYHQCSKCREYSKWRETVCRFCQTDLTVR
jgi:hypothetical protein